MPLLDGGTLRDRIQGGPVPLAKASVWISQLAGALDAAHEAGILHRDVKPANVLVGRGERVFLGDFGIAKMLETITGLTATGMVMGTPVYMAPEQAQGRPATPATDRYSLAVVAYEILAGRPPFEGESPLSLMHQHVASPAPALSTRVRAFPPASTRSSRGPFRRTGREARHLRRVRGRRRGLRADAPPVPSSLRFPPRPRRRSARRGASAP